MSTKFSLNWNDLFQSLKTGLFTAIIPIFIGFVAPVYNALVAGQIPWLQVPISLDFHVLLASLVAAVTATVGSVVKRFFQNDLGNLLTSSAPSEVAAPPKATP